ncbi:iduronate 2-sulfatase [Eurytemora carolleeae]|uniref:iduronate 2-sulfatase n=1 Tax=Eurytemora carolleeae TaxID=1294199 RepID=UPI000C75CA46|nr:iduronate 2-sulfatase [Eurytemora carolleeae]|eukprot:XP_023325307.1 iduronate 2-sulfatase-like [Eurytemora affinis]
MLKFLQILLLANLSVAQMQKNILFIAIDDLRPEIGPYADEDLGFTMPSISTPNIDSFSKESMVFKRAYAQQSLCSPSRSSMLTGRRPDTTHVVDLSTYFREVGGNFTTLPQFFKNNGYRKS